MSVVVVLIVAVLQEAAKRKLVMVMHAALLLVPIIIVSTSILLVNFLSLETHTLTPQQSNMINYSQSILFEDYIFLKKICHFLSSCQIIKKQN